MSRFSYLVKMEYIMNNFDPSFNVIFDETNKNWTRTFDHNELFLRSIQRYCNNLLKARGSVFLNEVFDQLKFPRTRAGAMYGWLKEDKVPIDFDIEQVGVDNAFALTFNVVGIIWDRI